MTQIEIDMLDAYKTLGAGRRAVAYLAFDSDCLVCRDCLGNKVRVPRRLFRFVRVLGRENRMTADGCVEVKEDGQWHDLGPLPLRGGPPAV